MQKHDVRVIELTLYHLYVPVALKVLSPLPKPQALLDVSGVPSCEQDAMLDTGFHCVSLQSAAMHSLVPRFSARRKRLHKNHWH